MYYKHSQVRELLASDLLRLERKGVCYIPEWVCHDLTKSVKKSGWKAVYYQVKSIDDSTVPLQADFEHLISLYRQYQNSGIDSHAAILAHPLGYVDVTIKDTLNSLKSFKNIFTILDLAQSYGSYDFQKEIEAADVAYISFNKNKLISKGGALRLVSTSDYSEYLKEFKLARNRQEIPYHQTQAAFDKLIKEHQSIFSYYNSAFVSSRHRTGILFQEAISKNLLKAVIALGLGQTVHPNPQENLTIKSKNYKDWENRLLLLFPKMRNL